MTALGQGRDAAQPVAAAGSRCRLAIIMLPRQFHVTVVENRTSRELKLAGILMPLYLVAINISALPAAIGGIMTFSGGGDADLYVLSLPLHNEMAPFR